MNFYLLFKLFILTLASIFNSFTLSNFHPKLYPDIGSFIHITDMHLDLDYSVGSPTQCILGSTGLGCCHKYDLPIKESNISGKWGDKNCDLPLLLFKETLNWINNSFPKLDFIIYGGDTIGHHDLSQTYSKNIYTMKVVSQLFYQTFKDNLFIINQGNHDTFPIDQTPPKIGKKMREAIISNLTSLMGDNAANQFINHGFMHLKVTDSLHIISINSIDYDSRNLFYKKEIKNGDQDIWLAQILKDIRKKGEYVYLVGHIFPSAEESIDIYNTWLLEYLSNYRDIILASFFGHSHNDEFRLHFTNEENVVAPILVTPSLMPDKRDPCFRNYLYHKTSNLLLDYQQYCVDLDQTNYYDKLIVYQDYQFSQLFNLPNISGKSFSNLLKTFKNKGALEYCQKYKGNQPKWNKVKCSTHYLSKLIEAIVI